MTAGIAASYGGASRQAPLAWPTGCPPRAAAYGVVGGSPDLQIRGSFSAAFPEAIQNPHSYKTSVRCRLLPFLQIFRREASVFGDAGEHFGTDLFGVAKGPRVFAALRMDKLQVG